MIHCGNTGNYMQLYLRVVADRIVDIRYLCSCEPTANVAVEILCELVRGRTLDQALALPEQDLYDYLGCREEEFQVKCRGLLEMLGEGIAGYRSRSENEDMPRA